MHVIVWNPDLPHHNIVYRDPGNPHVRHEVLPMFSPIRGQDPRMILTLSAEATGIPAATVTAPEAYSQQWTYVGVKDGWCTCGDPPRKSCPNCEGCGYHIAPTSKPAQAAVRAAVTGPLVRGAVLVRKGHVVKVIDRLLTQTTGSQGITVTGDLIATKTIGNRDDPTCDPARESVKTRTLQEIYDEGWARIPTAVPVRTCRVCRGTSHGADTCPGCKGTGSQTQHHLTGEWGPLSDRALNGGNWEPALSLTGEFEGSGHLGAAPGSPSPQLLAEPQTPADRYAQPDNVFRRRRSKAAAPMPWINFVHDEVEVETTEFNASSLIANLLAKHAATTGPIPPRPSGPRTLTGRMRSSRPTSIVMDDMAAYAMGDAINALNIHRRSSTLGAHPSTGKTLDKVRPSEGKLIDYSAIERLMVSDAERYAVLQWDPETNTTERSATSHEDEHEE